MIVYRLSHEKYAGVISGLGAAKYGQRWNSKGIEVFYTTCSISLALCELLVHLDKENIPDNYYISFFELKIDSTLISKINMNELPNGWEQNLKFTQKTGDKFIKEERTLGLYVPSAIIPYENNLLINPNHPDITSLKFLKKEKLSIDERLYL